MPPINNYEYRPINIYEYRVGNPPPGFWRYVYDAYPFGKPVEQAEEQGRAVFAAYRSHAPGTIPIFRHQYFHAPPERTLINRTFAGNESNPVSFELDERSSASDRSALTGKLDRWPGGGSAPEYAEAGMPNRRKLSSGSSRAFWAFPASSGPSSREWGTVEVYEHRLEVDILSGHHEPPRIMPRCLAYLKYSPSAEGGDIDPRLAITFDGLGGLDSLAATTYDYAWWGRYHTYCRYTRKIAFYAYPAS